MTELKMLSWNLNGIRAVHRKEKLLDLWDFDPDIVCFQETKVNQETLPDELKNINGQHSFFSFAERKGYSGVALYTANEPAAVEHGLGMDRFDMEGRTLVADYEDFVLFNIYFPNGKASKERLQYKMDFYDAFLDKCVNLRKKRKSIIVCGDVNTAHKEIDLARAKENEKISGFLPEERAWIDKFLEHGFVDTFRVLHPEPDQYTWWDLKSRARDRNVGWRIDYFYVSDDLKDRLVDAFILQEVIGSDHCPIGIVIDV